jgi:hypothetical protein
VSGHHDRHDNAFGAQEFAVRASLSASSNSGALSYSSIDRILDLKSGTAKAENFFVLVVRAREVPGTSIHRGDRLIVTRGARLASGGLLLCRRKSSLDLCVVRVDAFGQASLASPDPEFLPWPSDDALVLGTVIAAVRRNAKQLLVARPPDYSFNSQYATDHSRSVAGGHRLSDSELAYLRTEVAELEHGAAKVRVIHPGEAKVLESGAARLRALSRCLEVVQDQRLYAALLEQIDRTLLRLRRVLANRPRWARLRSTLKPLSEPERHVD